MEQEQFELNKILESTKGKYHRDVTLMYVLLYTGARATEALRLRPSDLNLHDETIFITGLKGSNDREIPVPSWLFSMVKQESDNSGGNGPIFNISYSRLRQIWEMYRPVKKKLHSTRHTFAINLYKRTKDLRLVQVALGHTNIQNTMVYAEYVYSQEELRKLLVA